MTISRSLLCCLATLTLTLAACDSASDDAGPTTIDADVLDTPATGGSDESTDTGFGGDMDDSTATGMEGDSDLSTASGSDDSDVATSTGARGGDLAPSTSSGDDSAATGLAPASAAPTETPDDADLDDPSLDPVEAKADAEAGLLATTVSVGVYPDYDRVTFNLDGEGAPGYSVRYADEAVEDGSGASLDVDGDAVLQVTITGTRYPDEGETYEGGPGTFSPDGAEEVEQVRLLSTFEGQTQAFIGVDDADTPFRVFTLSEPARLVVDVVHE